MKNIFKLFAIVLMLSGKIATAQTPWYLTGNTPGTADFLGSTNAADLMFYTNNAERARIIGVNTSNRGFMGLATNSPSSVLHIDGSTTPTASGETFRTNGPASTTTTWRMLTNGTEYGALFHVGTSTNFTIQATDNNLNLNSGFNGTGLEAIRIMGGNGANKRFVGIGDYASFTAAQNQLHQWITGNANVYHQFSNGSTGATNATDGFRIGITYNSGANDAELRQNSNSAINFLTNGSNGRMSILGNGNIAVGDYGSFTAASLIHQNVGSAATYHQFTNTATGAGSGTTGLQVGIDASGNAVIKSNLSTATMDFFTNGNNKRVTITAAGDVGIGYTSPARKLDVDGDVSMGIQGSVFMRTNTGTVTRTFSTAGTGGTLNNVSVGSGAGPATLTTRGENTYVGFNAGTDNGDNYNTFVGSGAGTNLSATSAAGEKNVYLGYSAGSVMTTGSYNLIAGAEAANNGTPFSGNHNSIIGYQAGNNLSISSVDNNVMLGYLAGSSITGGDGNVFIGDNTAITVGGVATDRAAFGSGAYSDCDHCIGLGNSSQRTGIGTASPDATARLTVSPGGSMTDAAHFQGDIHVNDNNGGGNGFFRQEVGIGTSAITSVSRLTVQGTGYTHAAEFLNGNIRVNGINIASDSVLKINLSPMTEIYTLLDSLNTYTYNYDTLSYPQVGLTSGLHRGFIAQEVKKVFPDLVRTVNSSALTDDAGNVIGQSIPYDVIEYTGITPLLWQALKEQKAQIEDLAAQVNSCCNSRTPGSTPPTTGSIELENLEGLQLLQNDPNPFSESTMIKWNLPDNFQNAVLYFYDNSGNQINSYKVNAKGAGELQIFGSRLSSGVYTYTLVVDGRVIDSKKMVKSSH